MPYRIRLTGSTSLAAPAIGNDCRGFQLQATRWIPSNLRLFSVSLRLRGRFLLFPITRDVGDHGDWRALRARPLPGYPTASPVIPEWRRFHRLHVWHSRPRLWGLLVRSHRRYFPHPAFFQPLLQTKHFLKSTLGSPLRLPWVTLG